MILTVPQLRAVFPLCRDPNLWASILPKVADEFEINTKDRFAAWLAQVGYESAQFNAMRENLSYSKIALRNTWPKRFPTDESAIPYERKPEALANFVYANRLGNGDVASGDGWKYRGGGLIETTGRANYRETGKGIGEPLEEQPNKMTIPVIAARAAGWFWKTHGCNELADARDLDGHIRVFARELAFLNNVTDGGDFYDETKIINGGTLGIENRSMNLMKLLTVLSPLSKAA